MGHNNLELDTSDWTMMEDGRKDGWTFGVQDTRIKTELGGWCWGREEKVLLFR